MIALELTVSHPLFVPVPAGVNAMGGKRAGSLGHQATVEANRKSPYIRLMPGLNSVADDLWTAMLKDPRIQRRVDSREIVAAPSKG